MPCDWSSDVCRSEEHTSELQSHDNLVCRLLLVKKKLDRKSTRLNSSHTIISYAVFCLKKKYRDLPMGWDRHRTGGRTGRPGEAPRARGHADCRGWPCPVAAAPPRFASISFFFRCAGPTAFPLFPPPLAFRG